MEKESAPAGVDLKASKVAYQISWLEGGGAVNDALLSGAIDIAGAGIGPFLTVWDRTLGTKLEVKIVGALGAQPNYLRTNKANIKTPRDFTSADKIARPAAGVSVQSRILQTSRRIAISFAMLVIPVVATIPISAIC